MVCAETILDRLLKTSMKPSTCSCCDRPRTSSGIVIDQKRLIRRPLLDHVSVCAGGRRWISAYTVAATSVFQPKSRKSQTKESFNLLETSECKRARSKTLLTISPSPDEA